MYAAILVMLPNDFAQQNRCFKEVEVESIKARPMGLPH
jgi:hypothetical protein